jgi:PAS domain S-box-containing protein
LDLISKENVFSQGALKILGFAFDQYTNNRNIDILNYVHPDDEDRIKYYLNRAITENDKFNQVFKISDSTGKIKTVHGKGEVINDTKKNKKVLFFTIQDISQIQRLKKQITNEENRYKLLAENSPVGVGMIYKSELVYVNKTLLDILGFNSTDEFRLSDVFLLVSPADIINLKEIADKINNKTAVYPIRNQIKFIRKDGNQCILNLILTECIIYDKTYIQAIVIDTTKEYEIEKKNKQLAVDSLYLNQKNKILHEIEVELNQILSSKREFKKGDFNGIYQIINSYDKFDKDWDMLKSHFEEIHSSFFHKLKTEYPLLTTIDLKHCACIKLNFTTKEIARFFNIKASSVQIARVRLKKKMDLPDSVDLRTHILSF